MRPGLKVIIIIIITLTDLNSNFEGHFSDGIQRRVQSTLSQMLLSNHVRYRLKEKSNSAFTLNKFVINAFCIHVYYCFILPLL